VKIILEILRLQGRCPEERAEQTERHSHSSHQAAKPCRTTPLSWLWVGQR